MSNMKTINRSESMRKLNDFQRTFFISQSDGIHINGWFLKLCYGNHRNSTCSLENLRLETLIVPVQVEDENTKTIKTSLLLGGFHGVDSFDGKHKPVLSFLVVDDRRTFSSIVEIKSE